MKIAQRIRIDRESLRTTILSRVEQARGSNKEIYFRRQMQEEKSD